MIERLPDGLNTRLGEGGWGVRPAKPVGSPSPRLSRGALLWLLDEPTAHLDADSERDVVEGLRRATDGCTVIIATHSFPLAAAAAPVLAIDNGLCATRGW